MGASPRLFRLQDALRTAVQDGVILLWREERILWQGYMVDLSKDEAREDGGQLGLNVSYGTTGAIARRILKEIRRRLRLGFDVTSSEEEMARSRLSEIPPLKQFDVVLTPGRYGYIPHIRWLLSPTSVHSCAMVTYAKSLILAPNGTVALLAMLADARFSGYTQCNLCRKTVPLRQAQALLAREVLRYEQQLRRSSSLVALCAEEES